MYSAGYEIRGSLMENMKQNIEMNFSAGSPRLLSCN